MPMFSPLGALGAFGGGLMQGMPQGMDLRSKWIDAQVNSLLGGPEGLGQYLQQYMLQDYQDYRTPSPGQSSEAAPTGGQPPEQQAGGPSPRMTGGMPGVMPGAYPPMPGGGGMQAPQEAAPYGQPNPVTLAQFRDPIRRELEAVPGLEKRLDEITTAEVGRDPGMRQRFQEGIINRVAASGGKTTLAQELENRGYYPGATFRRAAREGGTGQGVSPAMFDPTQPSNLSNYATGNASFDPRTGRYVGFAGGPQTGFYKGEQTGIEGRDLPTMQRVGYSGPTRTGLGPAGPRGPQEAGEPSPALKSGAQKLQSGEKMNMQELAQLIERRVGGANVSPEVKFRAMQRMLPMLNQIEQQRFNRFMQLENLQFRQRAEERAGRTEERALRTEERAQRTEDRRQQQTSLGLVRANPQYKSISSSMMNMRKRLDVVEELQDKTLKIGDKLIELANKGHKSGVPVFQAWINAGRRAAGDPLLQEFETQLATYRSDLARMIGSPGATVLAQGTKDEARELVPANLTIPMLESTQRALRFDAKVGADASRKIYNKNKKQLEQLYQQHGITMFPIDEPEPEYVSGEDTPAPAAAPSAIPPGVTITPMGR